VPPHNDFIQNQITACKKNLRLTNTINRTHARTLAHKNITHMISIYMFINVYIYVYIYMCVYAHTGAQKYDAHDFVVLVGVDGGDFEC